MVPKLALACTCLCLNTKAASSHGALTQGGLQVTILACGRSLIAATAGRSRHRRSAVMNGQVYCARFPSQRSCGSAASTSYAPVNSQQRSPSRRHSCKAGPVFSEPLTPACLSSLWKSLAKSQLSWKQRQRTLVRSTAGSPSSYEYDVVGLAQAMVDFGANVDDAFLDRLRVEKGGRRSVPSDCCNSHFSAQA